MQTHFYSHLIETEKLTISLSELDMTGEERAELITIFHETIHHKVLHVTLDELPNSDRKIFLQHIVKGEHETAWQLLKEKVTDAEHKIHGTITTLINEFIHDIHEIKKDHVKIK